MFAKSRVNLSSINVLHHSIDFWSRAKFKFPFCQCSSYNDSTNEAQDFLKDLFIKIKKDLVNDLLKWPTLISLIVLFSLLKSNCDVVSISVVTSSVNRPTFHESQRSSHSLVMVQTCSKWSRSFSKACRSLDGACSILKMFKPRRSVDSWFLRFWTCSWYWITSFSACGIEYKSNWT